jgi:Ca2+-binding RTX toxin-like protein
LLCDLLAIDCTLRDAIEDANAAAGADTIAFDIGNGGAQTIALAAPLPAITDPVTIDGTTQPGYGGTPIIELDGSGAGAGASGLKVSGSAANTLIKALAINKFNGAGITVEGTVGQVVIQGNFIGTEPDGTTASANGKGIELKSPKNTVGGAVEANRNVISGNTGAGVVIDGAGSSENKVQGNYIGLKKDGASALANGGPGVQITGAPNNSVSPNNVISGNSGAGVSISGTAASGNAVKSNKIGTNSGGTANVPNAAGIVIDGAGGSQIGGIISGDGNTIQGNTGAGISITGTGTANRLARNLISANGGLGIDLAPTGVTANDSGDGDSGPNNLQNFPVLTSAQTGSTVVTGTLNSAASKQYRLEFYASTACDAAGNGEGQRFLGAVNTTTDGSGNASFTANLADTATTSERVTVTATDPDGNTSEYSNCVTPTGGPAPTPPPGGGDIVGTEGNDVLVGTSGNDRIIAKGGNDTARGLAGDDLILGGQGNDRLQGGQGNDVLRGGAGKDELIGGGGNDGLFGAGGNDTLKGGPGFDECRGGPGKDVEKGC